MRIITNPGLNLTADEIRRHRVVVMPQRIMVDSVEHDTRDSISFAEIDRWVRDARQVPFIIGTTAAEFVDVYRRTAVEDAQLLVVTASKKFIGTYQAALSAARTFTALPSHGHARVVPLDCGTTDIPGAMAITLAGEASAAGLSFDDVTEAVRAFAAATRTLAVPMTLDNLVKGGRATFLRALLANTLGLSPLLRLTDGEMLQAGTTKRADVVASLRDLVIADLGRGARTPLWVGIAHSGNEPGAQALVRELSSLFDVQRLEVRPLCATTYLNLGPQSLAVCYTPLDKLPWAPKD